MARTLAPAPLCPGGGKAQLSSASLPGAGLLLPSPTPPPLLLLLFPLLLFSRLCGRCSSGRGLRETRRGSGRAAGPARAAPRGRGPVEFGSWPRERVPWTLAGNFPPRPGRGRGRAGVCEALAARSLPPRPRLSAGRVVGPGAWRVLFSFCFLEMCWPGRLVLWCAGLLVARSGDRYFRAPRRGERRARAAVTTRGCTFAAPCFPRRNLTGDFRQPQGPERDRWNEAAGAPCSSHPSPDQAVWHPTL